MRHAKYDPRHLGLRVTTRCSALLVALVLAGAPLLARASAPAAAPAPAEPPVTTTPDVVFEITPAPEPPQPEPEPQPEPPPPELPAPEPAPEATVEEPVGPPIDLAKVRTMRKAGIGVMAAGGGVALVGLGLTIAFSALGHKAQNAEEPDVDDIEQKNAMAGVGGALVASGIAIVAIGGIVYTSAKRKAAKAEMARVRVLPSAGGLALRF